MCEEREMAYLDWKNPEMKLEVEPHVRYQTQLKLHLSPDRREVLAKALEEVFVHAGRELRLGLPGGWVLFFKLREDGNRLLLAHPTEPEWVGTAALEKRRGMDLIQALKESPSGEGFQSIKLSELAPLASVSNLEILFL